MVEMVLVELEGAETEG